MTEPSARAKALLATYRRTSDRDDRPSPEVRARLEAAIAPPRVEPRPRRAAAILAVSGTLAAASAVAAWGWFARDTAEPLGPSPVSAAVEDAVDRAPRGRAVAPPVVPPAPAPAPAPPDPDTRPATTPAPRPSTSAAPPTPPPEDELARELRVLQQARQAIRQGRTSDAKAVLRAHALAHPEGQLAEEREALLVVVLCSLGESPTGEEAFAAAHPGSHHASAIAAACKKTPPAVTDEAGDGQ